MLSSHIVSLPMFKKKIIYLMGCGVHFKNYFHDWRFHKSKLYVSEVIQFKSHTVQMQFFAEREELTMIPVHYLISRVKFD